MIIYSYRTLGRAFTRRGNHMSHGFLMKSRVARILTFTFLLAACVDLSEVAKFAAISETANSSFPGLVADIQASCERRANHSPEDKRQEVLAHCKSLGTSEDGLLQAQQVLLNYIEALKNLSSDQTITYGEKLDALPDALSQSGLDDTQVKATTGLAKAIADAAIDGYRRKELGKLVGQTNGDIKTVTRALKKVIAGGYVTDLGLEEEAINAFFQTNLTEFGKQEPLTALLVRREWTEDLDAVQKRKDAAQAYGKVMDSIAAGHQKLYDSRGSWSTAELIKQLGPEISDIYRSTQEVHKAFK
jgi:hypothetical protein